MKIIYHDSPKPFKVQNRQTEEDFHGEVFNPPLTVLRCYSNSRKKPSFSSDELKVMDPWQREPDIKVKGKRLTSGLQAPRGIIILSTSSSSGLACRFVSCIWGEL
ncbi:hypothetical protein RRG08_033774 [Elysia crispata]|uniref:Uncharacterized protein n=1 Tax=Elysia crispata TaxID=231223 RepID=A0AAE1ARZ7_9GAST|nr:hypothetical protein RRG08_033774 [Elysia crispata]